MTSFRESHELHLALLANAPTSGKWPLNKTLLHSSHLGTSPHSYLAQ